jgi:anti-sigma factor RsiW
MTISEDRLLAYVDGLLSSEEAARLEQELASDAEARMTVEALRATALPFRDAVKTLIDVPDLTAIAARIDADGGRRRATVLRFARIAALVCLFFGAGVLAGHYALPPAQPEKTQWARWVEDIAAYQALYTRETLSLPTPDDKRFGVQMARVSKALGQKIVAPEFHELKADYKYARIYAIDGLPLAQIAYLPDRGAPFSICMMKTDVADHEPRYMKARGMNVATWRYKGIAYVFVGDVERAEMDRYIAETRKQQKI